MKPKNLIIIILAFILCFCSCQKREISVDAQQSYYSDFKIENGKVYIYCNVWIHNPNQNDMSITLTGVFDKDAKNGLLTDPLLTGYATDCETTEFKLRKGSNRIEVVFIGDYAGNSKKEDRLLPDIIIREKQ